ncbi:conserved exported protein of unknown function [Tenacibaculum sp. 190524A05c]
MLMKKLLSTLVFVFCCFIVSGQDQSLYSRFDEIVGQNNTKLSYGSVYKEKYRKKIKDNHNFYLTDSFKKGSVNYRGEQFDNVDIKYDLVDDFIIIKLNNQQQQISIIPQKNLITKFSIGNIKFRNSDTDGFLEELLVKDNFAVLKKHRKVSKENRDADYRYHTFKKREQHILFYNNSYYPIDSKRGFTRLFPEKKKQISKFYKSNTYLLKNDYKTFVAKLISLLQE